MSDCSPTLNELPDTHELLVGINRSEDQAWEERAVGSVPGALFSGLKTGLTFPNYKGRVRLLTSGRSLTSRTRVSGELGARETCAST